LNIKFIRVISIALFISYTLISLTCCKSKAAIPFIIAQHDRTKKLNRPHKFFYSIYNVILDTNGVLFFHNKDSLLNCCDTGNDLNYPDYIGLTPADIKVINNAAFVKMIDSAIKNPAKDKFSIQITIFNDTVTNESFFELLNLLHQKGFANYDVRRITEEEQLVLAAKKENKPYDFYNVIWKSRFSNTVFPPPPFDSYKSITLTAFDEIVNHSIELLQTKKLSEIADHDHINIMMALNTIFMRDFLGGHYKQLKVLADKKYVREITKVYKEWIPNRGMGFYFPKLKMELYGTPSLYAIFNVVK
jgi:hypothetical protein